MERRGWTNWKSDLAAWATALVYGGAGVGFLLLMGYTVDMTGRAWG